MRPNGTLTDADPARERASWTLIAVSLLVALGVVTLPALLGTWGLVNALTFGAAPDPHRLATASLWVGIAITVQACSAIAVWMLTARSRALERHSVAGLTLSALTIGWLVGSAVAASLFFWAVGASMPV
jgi:hypothetical protein